MVVRKEDADTDPQTPRGRAHGTDPGVGGPVPPASAIEPVSITGEADPDELLGSLAKQSTLPPKILRSSAGQSKAAYAAVGAPVPRQATPPPEPAVVVVGNANVTDDAPSQRPVVSGSANTTVMIPGRTRPRVAVAVLVGGVAAGVAGILILASNRSAPAPSVAPPATTIVITPPVTTSVASAAPIASTPAPTASAPPEPEASAIAPKPSPDSKKKRGQDAKPASSAPRELRLLPDEP